MPPKRIHRDEASRFFKCNTTEEKIYIGQLADQVRKTRHGSRTTFVHNLQINPSNVCVRNCDFCGFAVLPGESGSYSLDEKSILQNIAESSPSEVHIVGGLNQEWGFSRSLQLIKQIRSAFPKIYIKAFTAVEVDWFAHQANSSINAVLNKLKEAGLDCLPGGGAEIFAERIRKELFPRKINANRWLDIHKAAHGLNIPSNATLLYGLNETLEERLDHLFRLRELQDETGGFISFIPLAMQGGKSKMSPLDNLTVIAISRLILDNIPHIKAYWPMLGLSTAAVALSWGADDLDGTLGMEKVAHASGADSPIAMATNEMIRLIQEAGYEPHERNGCYQ